MEIYLLYCIKMSASNEPFTIELDCPPCSPRPDTYMPFVLDGTCLTIDDFDLVSKSFGNWTYECHKDKNELYMQNVSRIEQKITNLYNEGKIRYGSW